MNSPQWRVKNHTTWSFLLLATGILLGGIASYLPSIGSDLWPFLFMGAITLPLLRTGVRAFMGQSVDLFSPSGFFPVYMWIHIGWGTFLFMLNPIQDLELDPLIPLINLGAMYAYFAGLLLSPTVLSNSKSINTNAVRRVTTFFLSWSLGRLRWVLVGGILLSLAAATLFYQRAGGIPLLFANVEEGRVRAMWGNAYVAFLALSISYFYLAYWARCIGSARRPISLSLVALFVFAVVLQASFGYRSKIVWFVVTLLVAYNYLRSRIRLRHFVLFGVLLLIFVIGMGIWRVSTAAGEQGLDVTLRGLLGYAEHIFKRSTVGLIIVTRIFPEEVRFRMGQTYLSSFTLLLPGHQIEFTNWLKALSGLDFKGGGLPPSLPGELYLNFGIPGVLVGFFLLGLLLSGAYRWMRKHPSLLRVLVYAVILRNLGQSASGGFSGTVGLQLIWGMLLVLAIHSYVYRPVHS